MTSIVSALQSPYSTNSTAVGSSVVDEMVDSVEVKVVVLSVAVLVVGVEDTEVDVAEVDVDGAAVLVLMAVLVVVLEPVDVVGYAHVPPLPFLLVLRPFPVALR
jgi:hypothetical protein